MNTTDLRKRTKRKEANPKLLDLIFVFIKVTVQFVHVAGENSKNNGRFDATVGERAGPAARARRLVRGCRVTLPCCLEPP